MRPYRPVSNRDVFNRALVDAAVREAEQDAISVVLPARPMTSVVMKQELTRTQPSSTDADPPLPQEDMTTGEFMVCIKDEYGTFMVDPGPPRMKTTTERLQRHDTDPSPPPAGNASATGRSALSPRRDYSGVV